MNHVTAVEDEASTPVFYKYFAISAPGAAPEWEQLKPRILPAPTPGMPDRTRVASDTWEA